MTMVLFLKDSNFIPASKPVRHGFFGRRGGVSTGLYAELNCGFGTKDDPAAIIENQTRVMAALGSNNIAGVYQTHSNICHFMTEPPTPGAYPKGDALVTDRPGLMLRILTADCGPVLFYGEKNDGSPIIGAAHAGWGGALNGILQATIKTMIDHGTNPATLHASLGPCIGPKSYEVQTAFADPFLEQDPSNDHFFKSARSEGHLMFDLPGYIAATLAGAGVSHVSITGHDTYTLENDYFSYRRTTHRGENDYGRQISGLVIHT